VVKVVTVMLWHKLINLIQSKWRMFENKKIGMVVMVVAAFYTGTILAATCEIKYDRTACPGQEKISYKKCGGKKTYSKFKQASSVAHCRVLAIKSCANKRYSITKSKVITAVFDGKSIKTASGKNDFCLEYANISAEFNQCNK